MITTRASLTHLIRQTPLYTLVGPPGTGKTTTLTAKVTEAVRAGWQPLIASLTKTAAREVAGRGLPIHEHRIGTLHSHAFRALGLRREDVAEGTDGLKSWGEWIAERGLSESWRLSGGAAPSPDEPKDGSEGGGSDGRTDGDEAYEQIGVLRSRLLPVETWPLSLRAFYEAWSEWKAEAAMVDFEDMIERCSVDEIAPAVAFDALYVDEAQDLSASEIRLCATWARMARAFVVVGDPRQCLYEWRGSDPALFGELIRASRKTDVLRQSYRVPGAVHKAAVAWVDQLRDGLDVEYLPTSDAGDVQYRHLSPRHGDLVTSDVEADLAEHKTVMLLAACSYMLRPLLAALKSRGIPFHNPYRTRRGDWNPLARPESPTSSAGRLVAFSRASEAVWGADARFWLASELHGWTDALPADMFVAGGKTRIKRAAGKDGRPLTPAEFSALVPSESARRAMIAGDLDWYRDHMMPKPAKGSAFALEIASRRGVTALLERPKVVVGTMHSVKGGEAARVYLWPDLSPSGYETWMNPTTSGQVIRQVYVGMTRAKERLSLCSASSGRAVAW